VQVVEEEDDRGEKRKRLDFERCPGQPIAMELPKAIEAK